MSKPIGIFFCALIFLAGCTTAPKRPEKVISSPAPTQNVAAFNWADPNATHHSLAPRPGTQAMPITKINSPPPLVAAPIAPVEPMTWSSLNRWAAEHKISAPHFLSNTPLTTYAVSSRNGVLTLAIGSREASPTP